MHELLQLGFARPCRPQAHHGMTWCGSIYIYVALGRLWCSTSLKAEPDSNLGKATAWELHLKQDDKAVMVERIEGQVPGVLQRTEHVLDRLWCLASTWRELERSCGFLEEGAAARKRMQLQFSACRQPSSDPNRNLASTAIKNLIHDTLAIRAHVILSCGRQIDTCKDNFTIDCGRTGPHQPACHCDFPRDQKFQDEIQSIPDESVFLNYGDWVFLPAELRTRLLLEQVAQSTIRSR